MTFQQFNTLIQQQFESMQAFKLFRLNVSGQEIWDQYLKGFKPEQDPVFRDPNSSTHTCNNDMNFIRRYGNVVAIDSKFNVISMFDIADAVKGTVYEDTIQGLQKMINKAKVSEVFFETFDELNSLPYEKCSKKNQKFQLGHEKTLKRYTHEEAVKFGRVNTSDTYTFHHFHVFLNKEYVDMTGKSVESIMGSYRDSKNVFERAMEEISLDTLSLVKDLIVQGSLLNGDSYLDKLKRFIDFKKEYEEITPSKRNNWCWVTSYQLPIAKFRNELIGTLCVELSQGEDLNSACLNWNKRVDPANYMKAKSPITQRQIKEADQFVTDNGYVESFDRRFAVLADIDVSEIRHMNESTEDVKPAGLFDKVTSTKSNNGRHKRSEFDKIETVSIEKFMTEILPSCTNVEMYLENTHKDNLVSLITAKNPNSKSMFKWNNNFSWTYSNNLTGKSEIKEAVKTQGGNVEGILRFSMIWNESGSDRSDLDAWCWPTNGERIGYSQGYRKDSGNQFSREGGQLDLDNRNPGTNIGVENIYFRSLNELKPGKYKFLVHQFADRNSQGFKAEIEFDGQIYQYQYDGKVAGYMPVATITVEQNKSMTIEHHMEETFGSKNLWGLESNNFHKCNLICLSPNFWGENNVGNKHYMFFLEGCKSDTPLRSFHNEYLNNELRDHRKVLEVLASRTTLEPAKQQLCGVGFNATVSTEFILKLSGNFKRIIKVKI